MFSWILENRTWLFDGIGVAGVSFVLKIIFSRSVAERSDLRKKSDIENKYNLQEEDEDKKPTQNNGGNPKNLRAIKKSKNKKLASRSDSKPTPDQITKEIREIQPYLAESKKKSFRNVPADWKLQLFRIDRDHGDDTYHHIFATYKKDFEISLVDFQIDLEKFPKLKTLKKNEPIFVKGLIHEVNSSSIELINCDLDFASE